MSTSTQCDNFIGGKFVAPSTGKYMDLVSPSDGTVFGKVALSSAADVNAAVAHAEEAFVGWSSLTIKSRSAKMFKLHHLLQEHAEELATLASLENGKTMAEAMASVAKGNETVEWSCSLPQLAQGKTLQVSRGVTCSDSREPLGVVASVVPFNFPIMVPMWTVPIALTMGNCMILKPSEKCPLTMNRVAQLIQEAGVPDGVFQIVNGQADVVNGLCDNPGVSAVTFVGSSKVAEIVSKRCHALNKRTLCLGGAKNHLIALPDTDVAMAAADITSSFAGCAGQRCMAASVLLTVGQQPDLIKAVVEKARKMVPGQAAGQMGPVIDKVSQTKILKYIDEAEAEGATILLDGRNWATEQAAGSWVGPTVILHKNKSERALHDEIFGPVLSVLQVATKEEAMQIENDNPHGNAACVYTTSGGEAEWCTKRFRAAMLGVNIGIPVPREPFSFGGLYGTLSKFGDHDITADGAMEFFSTRRKITSKWIAFGSTGLSSTSGAKEERDLAQFGAFEAADK